VRVLEYHEDRNTERIRTSLRAQVAEEQRLGRMTSAIDPGTVTPLLLSVPDGLELQHLLDTDEVQIASAPRSGSDNGRPTPRVIWSGDYAVPRYTRRRYGASGSGSASGLWKIRNSHGVASWGARCAATCSNGAVRTTP
jgi:hypothetical protein